jgi:hypothetical protein
MTPTNFARLELAYHELNRSYGNPYVLHLTERGFYSEVNNVITQMMFALAQERRLIVDQSRFNDLRWNDFYRSFLPDGGDQMPRLDEASIIRDHHAPMFDAAKRWLERLRREGLRVDIPRLGISGTAFEIRRALMAAFCAPRHSVARKVERTMRTLGLESGKFAALHVRRGDKIRSHVRAGGRIANPEGEDTPASAYVEALRNHGSAVRSVFVLTDDASYVAQLRVAAPALQFYTLAAPDDAGHGEAEFNARAPHRKRSDIERLLVEVEIAAHSAPFIGPYKSNVSRHIVNRHMRPEACHTIDSRTVCM